MQKDAWLRKCDICNQEYIMNKKDIPRIYISRVLAISDIDMKDYIASPDLCDLCILPIIRMLERKNKLRYSVNGNRIIQTISKSMQ